MHPATAEMPVQAPSLLLPNEMFLTKGVGRHKHKLTSFEMALRDGGIAAQNIVTVSSIYPAGCKIIPAKKGIAKLEAGAITFAVLARQDTQENHRLIASSIGMAIPKDVKQYGYLSEIHTHGQDERRAGDEAEDLAASMLATTLGIDFDPETAWDDRKEEWKMDGRIVRTTNCTQTAIGKEGLWTTVISAAVFCGYT